MNSQETREFVLFSLKKLNSLLLSSATEWKGTENRAELFSKTHGNRIKDKKHNLEQGKFLLDIRKNLTVQMGKYSNHQILEQAAKRGNGISIIGAAQNSAGQCLE